jgi:hypothetical protein
LKIYTPSIVNGSSGVQWSVGHMNAPEQLFAPATLTVHKPTNALSNSKENNDSASLLLVGVAYHCREAFRPAVEQSNRRGLVSNTTGRIFTVQGSSQATTRI